MPSLLGVCLKLTISLILVTHLCDCQFEWIVYDRIDEIMEKMNADTADNWHQKQPSELQLIDDVVHEPPTISLLKTGIILANRTQLLHTRNVAHKNAILYSFQLQNLFDFDQPGLMYYYLHAAADISGARAYLNQSGIIYDTDKAYAHWYVCLKGNM